MSKTLVIEPTVSCLEGMRLLRETGTSRRREEAYMSTRTRLNRAFLNGSLLVAGVIGVASGSFGVFAVSFAGLLAANVVFREIRLPRNWPR
jgi:hypothetical protein